MGSEFNALTTQHMNVGVTPFRGKADPGPGYFDSPRFKAFEGDLHRTASELGVRVDAEQHAQGVWEGTQEPAVSVDVAGSDAAVRKFAARLGSKYNQDSVMLFRPDPKGGGFMYTVRGVTDPGLANGVLAVHGISGGRVVGGNLEIVDPDGSQAEAAARVASDLGKPFDYHSGHVTFIDKGQYGALAEAARPSLPEGTPGRVADTSREGQEHRQRDVPPRLVEADSKADFPSTQERATFMVRHPTYGEGVSLKKDRKGFFVHTNRARSGSYATIEAIPASVVKFVESTG